MAADVRVLDPTVAEMALARRLLAEMGVADGALALPRPEALLALVEAARFGARLQRLKSLRCEGASIRFCQVCGCTNTAACVVDGVPCHWERPEICSTCAPYLEGGR
ncbi:MAG TPA: hypothetical protein VG248_17405 [Caulobacteraceae bacterium]|nr:hypothetical protein [Caulobacteraceae bacterium]